MIIKGVLKMRSYDFPKYPYRAVFHDVPKAEACYIDMEPEHMCAVMVSFNYLERAYRITDVKQPECTGSIAFFKGFLKENGWREETEE